MTDLSLVRTLGAILSSDAHDLDPAETAEWRDALDALTAAHGPARARFILDALLAHARRNGVNWLPSMTTPYVNSIPLEAQPPFPGDLAMEQRLAALMRWNALAMVMRANQVESGGSAELGGHIASYASAADLFEVGFNHFFRARNDATGSLGDLVFFQPHSAPGVYARAFLEGRLSADDLAHYRQELSAPAHGARGLSSVSASDADAGLLAVPDRLDGHRADQRDLPGALHALPAAPRPARPRRPARRGAAPRLGLLRRRRDGRARVDRRAVAGRARDASTTAPS